MKHKNILIKTTGIIIIISVISKFLGLLRESTVAAYFGATGNSDAIKLAYDIPAILLVALTSAFATSFIPVYSNIVKNSEEKEQRKFVNNSFTLALIFSTLITIISMVFSNQIINFLAPGMSNNAKNLTLRLTNIMLPGLVFITMSYMANSYLQVHKKFYIASTVWIAHNIIVIGSIVLLSKYGLKHISIGWLIALSTLFLLQIPWLIRTNFKYYFYINIKDKNVILMFKLMIPIFVSSLFTQAYLFFARAMASGLDAGSISVLDYANKVQSLIFNIFILSVSTVVYPSMSDKADNLVEFESLLKNSLKTVLLITFFATSVLIVLKEPIIRLLFERGEFKSSDTIRTSQALLFYAFGLTGVAVREIVFKAFYALKNSKTPMVIGIITISVNMVIGYNLVGYFGLSGITFAYAFAVLLSATIALIVLGTKLPKIINIEMIIHLFKTLLAASIAAFVMAFVCKTFEMNLSNRGIIIGSIQILIAIFLGFNAFILTLLVLRVDIVYNLISNLFKKIRLVGG